MKKILSTLLLMMVAVVTISAQKPDFTVKPADGAEVTKLQVVTIDANSATDYYFESVESISDTLDDFEYADAKVYFKCGEEIIDASCSAFFTNFSITAEEAITTPGEWQLVIEKGALQWGEYDEDYTEWTTIWTNEENLVYTYTVKGAEEKPEEVKLPFTLDPAAGSEVESLASVTLNFTVPLEDNVDINPWNVYFAKNGENCFEGKKVKIKVESKSITISPASEITEAGEYQLIFKANSLDLSFDSKLEGFGYNYRNQQELSFTYTIVAKTEEKTELDFTVKPADGAEVKTLQVVSIDANSSTDYYFESVESISDVNDNFQYADAKAYFKCGEEVVDASCSAFFTNFSITAEEAITTPGEWQLVIEKGALQWGEYNEDYTEWTTIWTNEENLVYTYIIKDSEEKPEEVKLPFTVSPEDGASVAALESVTLDFGKELDSVDINPWNVYFAKNGEKYNEGKVVVTENLAKGTIKIAPSKPITENGEYKLIIPAKGIDIVGDGIGKYDHYQNEEELTFTFVVDNNSGIEEVNMNNANEGVFNLFGMKVADTTESLNPGIYIVNGRKIVIR